MKMTPSALFTAFLYIIANAKEITGLYVMPHQKHRQVSFQQQRQGRLLVLCNARQVDTEDQERLLLTEPALSAYVGAEVHGWLLQDLPVVVVDDEISAKAISDAARVAYSEASKEGILSNHGALIAFITSELRTYTILEPHMKRLKTRPHGVAKRCVDMLHHIMYRGTYTSTQTPIGVGEIAAREAVGLPAIEDTGEDEDNCIVIPPPEIVGTDCLWTESEDVAWRKKRFERITMEGFRDPRRGNSGTSR